MERPKVVSEEEWLAARRELLEKEKAHSRARDELTKARQRLPWVRMEKEYVFEGPEGPVSLSELFDDKGQLIVQHFMFGSDWEEGCKSCSFMADHMNPAIVHLANRDVAFVAVSTAPLDKLLEFKKRMGWSFRWVSSGGTDFNRDFHVTFTDDEIANEEVFYNFRGGTSFAGTEAQGLSVFAKDEDGHVFHTYSRYGRGCEDVMTAYDLLDYVPKGRNEKHNMDWLRLKDRY
jgi:predicted dithiol-disulfide oxidoreductase (DUF899 family)